MSKKLIVGLMAVGTLCGSVFAGENLLTNSSAADGVKNWQGGVKIADGGKDQACFLVDGSKKIVSKQLIEIDPTATYKLTGSFKSGSDKPNQIYFGLALYDKNKHFINATSVTPVADSATVLVAPANKGDKIIKVKSVKNWESVLKKKRLLIAFDIDDSGAYSDLPNHKFSNSVTKLEEKNGTWEATLKTPLNFSFPANTKVRAQLKCGHLMYAVTLKKHLDKWTALSNTIAPAKKSGSQSATMWHGTSFVKILLLANWGQKDGEVLLIKDIKLEKVEK
ncbi:MAG: hypothetical protein L3J71_00855 [Victivallaceae bacterium]|nr:hypothetical protein [Victivallaceae bacterium]